MDERFVAQFLANVRRNLTDTLHRATVPILADQEGPKMAGTGVLLRVGDADFLVSAAHVLTVQKDHGIDLLIPWSAEQGMRLGGELAVPRNDQRYDVGVLRLSEEISAGLLERGCRPVNLAQVHDVDPVRVPEGGYALYGYPQEGAREESDGFHPVPHYLGCVAYHGPTGDLSSDFEPDHHFLLSLIDREVRDQDTGAIVRFPSPRGMSGCSVWWTYESGDTDAGWSPQRARWVGIQSAFFRDPGLLKVIPFGVVRRILVSRWPDLAHALSIVVPGPGR